VQTAAIFGTKNSINKTQKLLAQKCAEKGWSFTENDFVIEKNSAGDVTITLTYIDEIKIFGLTLK
jgi:hypothetical protein